MVTKHLFFNFWSTNQSNISKCLILLINAFVKINRKWMSKHYYWIMFNICFNSVENFQLLTVFYTSVNAFIFRLWFGNVIILGIVNVVKYNDAPSSLVLHHRVWCLTVSILSSSSLSSTLSLQLTVYFEF